MSDSRSDSPSALDAVDTRTLPASDVETLAFEVQAVDDFDLDTPGLVNNATDNAVGSDAVTITSDGGTDTTVVTVNDGQTLVTDVEVTVGDENVTYFINDGVDRDLFTVDAVTGILSFITPPDSANPTDSNGDNVYGVNVIAAGATTGDSQFIAVVVESAETVAITSDGGTDTTEVTVNEGQTLVTDVEVTVGDENVTYFINGGVDRDLFTVDAATGVLSFLAPPDGANPTDTNGDNIYEVNIIAAGTATGDSQFIAVVVEDNTPPLPALDITTTETVAFIQENKRYVTDININGAERNVIYSLNGGADAALFEIDATTGVLSFKQAPDWDVPLDTDNEGAIRGDNNYEVNVLAVRDNEADTQFLTVIVTDIVDETAVPVPVYLLAGQSNLVGEAETANLSDPTVLDPLPTAQIWSPFQNTFIPLANGFDGQTLKMGTEFGFGRQAVALSDGTSGRNPDGTVYLVKYGLGATSLAEDWNPDGTGAQYNQFVSVVDDALTGLATSGVAYEVAGLVWQQGESDTYNDGFALAYEDNLTQFIDRVRGLYGDDLAVSVGQLRSDLPTSSNNRALVQAAQQAVADATLGVSLLNTDALGSANQVLRVAQNDLTHYSADGQILLGQAHAEAFLL